MTAIKAVIFDLDDTLLWDAKSVAEAFQATCKEAAKKHALKPEQLEQSVRKHAKQIYASYDFYPFTQNIGINPFEGLWGNFGDPNSEQFAQMKQKVPEYRRRAWTEGLREIGIDDPELGAYLAEYFPKERRARPIVYDETFEVLDQLSGNYKLMLLTNGSPELQQEKLAAVPKLPGYFDHIVVSGSFGMGKPARPLFEHVLELLQIEPEAGVMVGDKLTTDIKGALGVGLHSVWINREEPPPSEEIRPEFEIRHLNELFDILARLNGNVTMER